MDVGVPLFDVVEGEGWESVVVVASGFAACVVGGDVVVTVLGGF